MENVYIMEHPLIQHKISMLRDKNTGTNEFRKLVEEIAVLMAYEAFRDLPMEDVEVETPIETCQVDGFSKRLSFFNGSHKIFPEKDFFLHQGKIHTFRIQISKTFLVFTRDRRFRTAFDFCIRQQISVLICIKTTAAKTIVEKFCCIAKSCFGIRSCHDNADQTDPIPLRCG